MFRVGQRVVRIGGAQKRFDANYPELGQPYTIRGMYEWRGKSLLLLAGIDNTHVMAGIEPGFDSRWFRPVVDRKYDISIFTAMLNPSRKKERA